MPPHHHYYYYYYYYYCCRLSSCSGCSRYCCSSPPDAAAAPPPSPRCNADVDKKIIVLPLPAPPVTCWCHRTPCCHECCTANTCPGASCIVHLMSFLAAAFIGKGSGTWSGYVALEHLLCKARSRPCPWSHALPCIIYRDAQPYHDD